MTLHRLRMFVLGSGVLDCAPLLIRQGRAVLVSFPFAASSQPQSSFIYSVNFASTFQKKGTVLLRVSAVVLTAYAVAFLINPMLLGKLVGFTHQSPNTLVEVTAFYGGLELGMALFLFWSSLEPARVRCGLMMVFFVFLCAGLARLLGVSLYGFEDPSQPIVTGLEIIWSLVAAWMARAHGEQGSARQSIGRRG